MPGQARIIGIVLIAVALVACLIATALLLAQVSSNETTVTERFWGSSSWLSSSRCLWAAVASTC